MRMRESTLEVFIFSFVNFNEFIKECYNYDHVVGERFVENGLK